VGWAADTQTSAAIKCDTEKDDNLATIEQYDPRADNDSTTYDEFLAPNTTCDNCVYTSWEPPVCTYKNIWQETRSVTHKKTAEYCGETIRTYGTCNYCASIGVRCFYDSKTCCDHRPCSNSTEDYWNCPTTYTTTKNFKRRCPGTIWKEGCSDCKLKSYCASNNSCLYSADDIKDCP
jgi:hypothetical protein